MLCNLVKDNSRLPMVPVEHEQNKPEAIEVNGDEEGFAYTET